ncbi:MAG: response regulator [Oscillatoriophycideae cyanobacterium NC_groundwater_1537_Pr4_S-0.65um_50_18]|nr:response regulator [Oscillatoriophycideae cyanobacterium NC_groundwater_1537_Pr4_S-0.65um_50_18]
MITPESCHLTFQAQELSQELRKISKNIPTSYWLIEFPDLSKTTHRNTWHLALSKAQIVFSGDQKISWKWLLECFQRYVPRFRNAHVKDLALKLERLTLEYNYEPAFLFEQLNQFYDLNLISPHEARQALWLSLLSDCDTYLFDYAGQASCLPIPESDIQLSIAGFDIEDLLTKAKERQVWWYKLQSLIPSMESFPVLNASAVSAANLTAVQQQRLQALVSEGKTLTDISVELGQDPLETAKVFSRLISERLVTLTSLEPNAAHEIVVIDDSQILLRQFENLVASWGYSVRTFDNPITALQMLPSSNPGVIFLDINMPEVNGFDLIKQIRRQPKLSTLPLVMLTAEKTLSNNWRSRLSGCRFLSKPLTSSEIPQFQMELRMLLAEFIPICQHSTSRDYSVQTLKKKLA